MKVTKIEFQKKNSSRVSVFCDEEYAFSLQTETLLKNGISVGTELTDKEIEMLINESDALIAINQATVYVSKGLKTKNQVEQYLKKRDFNNNIIQNTINKLTQYDLINDSNFIKAYVADHSSYGELKLKQELILKGLDKDLIEEYFQDNYEVNLEKLEALKDKFLKNKPITYENIIKCKKHLISKGFKYEDIQNLNWSNYESWN